MGLCLIVALVAELANLLHVMDQHRARWMEAQQRINFSQKRKEVIFSLSLSLTTVFVAHRFSRRCSSGCARC